MTAAERDNIIAAVVGLWDIDRDALLGPCRSHHLVRGRRVAMWLMRNVYGETLPRIGEIFGGRDHTTVMHACREVDRLLPDDAALRVHIDGLILALEQKRACQYLPVAI